MTTDFPKAEDRASRAIEYLKLCGQLILGIGALVTIIVGVREFSLQRQQNDIVDMLGFINTIDQGNGAISFRTDIQYFVEQFYDKNFYPGNVDIELQKDPRSPAINKAIQTKILSTSLMKFKRILSFIDQAHVYAATNACAWEYISPAFKIDAEIILYYFSPVLNDSNFVNQQSINTVSLENFRDGKLTDQNGAPIPLKPPCKF